MAVAAQSCEVREWARREQVDRSTTYFVIQLAQRRNIIEHPAGTPVGGDNEIAVLDDKIMNGNGWQVQLKGLPVCAIVEGNMNARLCSREKQPTAARVFADDTSEDIFCKAVGDLGPGLPIVVSLVKIGVVVVQFVAGGRKVGGGR